MSTSQDKIKDALLELLELFPYTAINISAVCDKAGISRRTFTRYYESLEDVAREIVISDVATTGDNLLKSVPTEYVVANPTLIYTATYQEVFSHRMLYTRTLEGLGGGWLVDTIYRAGRTLDDEAYRNRLIPEAEAAFAMHFFAGVNSMAIRWWVENGFSVSPEELAELVIKCGYAYIERLPRV